jgi:uncharacterized membrane protein
MFFHMQHLPVAPPFFLGFAFALALLLLLLQIRVLRYAYMRLGVSSGGALLLLLASLIGSTIDIPIAQLGARGVILAVNVGGAVIPTLLSFYLLARRRIRGAGLLVTAIMAAICHALAQPLAGVGIAIPTFAPPIAAALVAALICWRELAPLAYIGGSLGVLIGADLANLGKMRGLGAPMASIGGAGTFDGIFVTGLLAVLLASIARGGETES